MKTSRWKSLARSWAGILAALIALIAAVWLLSMHIHTRRILPVEKALVDSLKEKAKTDVEVQKILQPELDRQHESFVKRQNAYDRGGLVLLISAGIFFAWFRWLRPERGAWVGVPAGMQRYLDKLSAAHIHGRCCPAARCKAVIGYHILDSCIGCGLCADACAEGAIEARPGEQHEIIDGLCTRCGACVTVCPEDAIEEA